jgi:hypothetical protein
MIITVVTFQTNSFFYFQCRTDRIVFKLFGKDPHDFPMDLRAQVILHILLYVHVLAHRFLYIF